MILVSLYVVVTFIAVAFIASRAFEELTSFLDIVTYWVPTLNFIPACESRILRNISKISWDYRTTILRISLRFLSFILTILN